MGWNFPRPPSRELWNDYVPQNADCEDLLLIQNERNYHIIELNFLQLNKFRENKGAVCYDLLYAEPTYRSHKYVSKNIILKSQK